MLFPFPNTLFMLGTFTYQIKSEQKAPANSNPHLPQEALSCSLDGRPHLAQWRMRQGGHRHGPTEAGSRTLLSSHCSQKARHSSKTNVRTPCVVYHLLFGCHPKLSSLTVWTLGTRHMSPFGPLGSRHMLSLWSSGHQTMFPLVLWLLYRSLLSKSVFSLCPTALQYEGPIPTLCFPSPFYSQL